MLTITNERSRRKPKSAYLSLEDLARNFIEQVRLFGKANSGSEAVLAMPVQHPLRAMWSENMPMDYIESVLLTARAWSGKWNGPNAVIQAVTRSSERPRQLLSTFTFHDTLWQATDLLPKCFAVHDRLEVCELLNAFPIGEDMVKRVKPIDALRPLQLYSVTGGKLAQLLL